ncbi:uncharacterized protein F5Z01DRAFT_680988 [Emericellopsis atlantica]|uniref:PH domain-containing protein n=1 Tax=Emericellopsis atlantica TaxID=2614577 RepID=A0A9P8CPU1_9HYPO|nr:uncharacterized protein F5Z01DRAFT_680988 [Emericellopsis atlantica]KAG9254908.1 hypothetical protein F5Z01DRAFT_680988 [Emericellopsis atlantica]
MAEAPLATPAAASKPSHRAFAVGLHEAALDSPTFRATAAHFAEQIEAVEKWLNGYVNSTSKLLHDIIALEDTINSYLTKTIPSAADGVIDNDYTFLALKRVGDGSREWWMQLLSSMKKMETTVVEPVRSFLVGDMRNFKEIKKVLEQAQRTFDTALARYVAQSKTKEASHLREDAFSVYEARKAYLQASMDFCQLAPQVRFTMDKVLVKVSGEIWKELKRGREAATSATRHERDMDRVRGWAREMEISESVFRRELQIARRDLGDQALIGCKPSRELEDYSTSTVPFLGSRGPMSLQVKGDGAVISEKQGWLYLRTLSGKPARHNWVRRWYYCRDRVFGWLIPGPQGVLQGDEIGVLLCNAKPAPGEDRRFCFEVKTKNQTMMLQAETQGELTEWLEVFEVTKKKAFEATMDRDSISPFGTSDPAFSISPPTVPEFSARILDTQMALASEEPATIERAGTLPVPGVDALASRSSFDVNGSLSRRSITALGRDLAREEGESGREHAARIISKLDLHRKATFGAGAEAALAGSSGAAGGLASLIAASHNLLPGHPNSALGSKSKNSLLPSLDSNPGTLAPLTLAKPPAITNLSRTAVLTAAQRDARQVTDKLPPSVLANYWGTNAWGVVNTPPPEPVLHRFSDDDPVGVVVSPDNVQTPLIESMQKKQTQDSLPHNYPPELRAQHAQFRLLFPTAPPEEKLVLVFRAAWSSTASSAESMGHALAGDGRIFVTPDHMYFYGQQMGLVTAYTLPLDMISEVTASPGKEVDFIFLHLGQDTNDTGYAKITLKIFLDDLRVLHTRLNMLIDDLQAEEPMDTEAIITALINVEREGLERPSPSAESWEEIPSNTPYDDGTPGGRNPMSRSFEGSPRLQPSGSLQLPTHAIMAAERHFEISANFVFPKLYFEHRAQQIAQGPWVLVDQGRMRHLLGRTKTVKVTDHQTIDMHSEHTAWHLPHHQHFKLITKIVITLAIYTPALSKNLIERQALHDLAELVTDQVRKLGARSRTNRAIQVYGHVGHQTQMTTKTRTLTALIWETVRSFGESAVSSLIMKLFKVLTAQRLLLALLALSTLTNMLLTATETSTWWKERRAAGLMRNLGAIYISDLGEASESSHTHAFPQNSTCFDSFQDIVGATDMDAPWQDAGSAFSSPASRSTAKRTYRHDLVKEMLQSEWENWLANEVSLKDEEKSGKGRDESMQKVLTAMPSARREALIEWRDKHCGSCKSDYNESQPKGRVFLPIRHAVLPRNTMGGTHHEAFTSLCPVNWADVPKDDLKPYLNSVFTEASTVVESIPSPTSKASSGSGSAKKGRARSKTDSAVLENDATVPVATSGPGFRPDPATVEQALKLKDEWKDVKVNPRENPLGVQVYKLSAKDGKGAWFARRSVHEGLTFDQWVAGMKREFLESMKVDEGHGSGAIRGLGADQRVENHEIDDDTQMQVFQLSAQFPGPTSPRDFITLLLTTTFPHTTSEQGQPLRQFMVVSKPVTHPECPPRSGVIRGHYESVEIIREIPVETPLAVRSQSALDLPSGRNASPNTKAHSVSSDEGGATPVAIEWLMVTRSDPGGSVPRFMIEKGTPPGIVNDAKKFLDWVTRESLGSRETETNESAEQEKVSAPRTAVTTNIQTPAAQAPARLPADSTQTTLGGGDENGDSTMITGAFGAASNVVSGSFKAWNGTDNNDKQPERLVDSDDVGEESSLDDASSIVSFSSALEKRSTNQDNDVARDTESLNQSEDKSSSTMPQQKELRRLEERRRKLDEKASKMTERVESRRSGDKEKDAAALAKIREKHEKEVAKQEAKYQRELRKIEEKREQEERKAEERRRKAMEKEERSNMNEP